MFQYSCKSDAQCAVIRAGAKVALSSDNLGLVVWHPEPCVLETFRMAQSPGDSPVTRIVAREIRGRESGRSRVIESSLGVLARLCVPCEAQSPVKDLSLTAVQTFLLPPVGQPSGCI